MSGGSLRQTAAPSGLSPRGEAWHGQETRVTVRPVSSLLLSTCTLGLSLGLRHAFDSDHVAAITTMVTGGCSPRQAATVGASWGAGHAAAVVGLGVVVLLAGVQVPASMAVGFDLAVVALMAVLGLRALRGRVGDVVKPRRSAARALGVGVIHGVSGTAAVALLALTRAPSQAHGVGFLLIFSLAATLSMTCLSFLLALPLAAATRRSGRLARGAQALAGVLALGAAAVVLFELCAPAS